MVETRRAGADQWQTWRGVRLRALQEAPSAFGSTYARELAFTEDVWRGRLEANGSYLAFVGGAPIGLAAGWRDPDGSALERELVAMWVTPEARGRGFAGRLIAAVAGWARTEGATELRLWVVDGNDPARMAYVREGFVATGEAQPVEPGDPRIELRMALRL